MDASAGGAHRAGRVTGLTRTNPGCGGGSRRWGGRNQGLRSHPGRSFMRIRVLIGLVLALLVVVAVIVYPWRSSDSRPDSEAPPPPAAAFQPVPGAEGIGDPYFPRAGNGGYDVTGYDIQIRYDPPSDRLEGHTTVTARATQDLSQFNLDLRLPATAVAVDGQPAGFRQDGGGLQGTPAAPGRGGQPM